MTELRSTPAPAAETRGGADRPPPAEWARPALLVALLTVVAVVAVGVVARFVTGSPLWLDEAMSVTIARLDLADLPAALRRDGHPPLYYLLLHGWTALFGDGDLAARSLSGLFGVLTLPLAWCSGRRAAGRSGAVAALVVVAMSPFAVRYATEARMYAMVIALVFAGHLLVRDALDRDGATGPRRLVGLAAVAGALYLTHYWSFYLAAVTVVALAVVGRRDPRRWRRRAACRAGIGIVGGGAVFLPWLPSFLSQLGATGTPWGTAARPTDVFGVTLVDFGGPDAEGLLLAVVVAVLAVLGLFAVGRARGTGASATPGTIELDLRTSPSVRGEVVVAVATLAVGTLVGFATDAAFASRYAATVFPLVVVVAARGISVIPAPRGRIVALAVVAALGAAGLVRNVIDERTQAEQLAAAIAAAAGPDDIVVTCPDQLGPAMVRALDQQGAGTLRVAGYPTLARPERIDWTGYEERNDAADPSAVAVEVLASTAPEATVWLVLNPSYRTFEGQCELLELVLGTARPVREVLPAAPGRFFENGELLAFGPTGSTPRTPAPGAG